MSLVKINITKRASASLKGGPAFIGFDANDIVVPIRFNTNTNESYFTSRTIKDGDNSARSNAKIDYSSSETLASIASKSELFILLNVLDRRGVTKNEPYIFISNRISENFTYEIGVGTTFYYIEDGDPLPVKYTVIETIDQIIAQQTKASAITKTEEYFEFVSGASLALANTPLVTEIFTVFRNGELLTMSKDYSLTAPSLSFTVPLLNDNINVIYSY